MFTMTMSTKGQVTLPRQVRETLKLHPGCKVHGNVDERGRLVLVASLHEPEELFEGRPSAPRALSVAEMNAAIGKAVRRGGV
jgi:bifunctional DNA-binding transcriptional regulator/antitoxin component of YhaV-PrlF toxin-antitoxin module